MNVPAPTTRPITSQRDTRSPAVNSLTQDLVLRGTPLLVVGLLTVVTLVAGYGLYTALHDVHRRDQLTAWAAAGMLVLAAIVALLISRLITQRTLRHIQLRLQELTRDDELTPLDAPVPGMLEPVIDALSAYVLKVRTRVDHLRMQKKEIEIQRRAAEAERQNTEAIIFSISDAVLVVDSFGELLLANTAAEKLFNFRFAEWRHRPIDRFIEDTALLSLLKEARNGINTCTRRQVEYSKSQDGRIQTYNITLSTVLDAGGQARGAVAVFHDITREREIAQIKSDFVSAVSHELRTPLSSVKAYVEMLIDGEAQDEATRRRFYQIIATETDRLQRLIDNILNISRIESGVVEVRRQPISANEVVAGVVEMMMPQAREKNIELVTDLAEELSPAWADRDLMYQAVLNVVSNAIKYSRPQGHVLIRTEANADQGMLSIIVTDNGIGIRAADLPRIFDKFYRSPDHSGYAKGTGLGLNLVKHIVETVHGGQIAVTSEVNVGTTMVLRFPCFAG